MTLHFEQRRVGCAVAINLKVNGDRLGLLEKLAGWKRLFETPLAGIVRSMNAWLDLNNNKILLMAGDGPVTQRVNNLQFTLPLLGVFDGTSGTSFSVTAGSSVATVNTANITNLRNGTSITFAMQTSIGGIHIASGQSFTVSNFVMGTPSTFQITLPAPAVDTDVNNPGVPVFFFDWTSSFATVAFENHGLSVGNTFLVDQRTTITQAGANPYTIIIPSDTNLTVTGIVDANHFTFNWMLYAEGGVGGVVPIDVLEGTDQVGGPQLEGLVFGAASPTLPGPQTDWFTANLGQVGLVLFTGGPLFVAQRNSALSAVGLANLSAPQINNAMLVAMPQAQVLLLGSETIFGSGVQDPLLIRWSDAGTFDVYTATVTNQAGSFRLSRGSKIIGGLQSPQTTLIWTDTDVWSMSYIGPPLVYGFTIMASGCGLIAPHAAVTVGGTTVWLSRQSFWQFSGGGVAPLPCPQWDFIFRDLNLAEAHKIHAGGSTSTHELYLFFCSLIDQLPLSANLLSHSQTFSNNAWMKNGLQQIVEGLVAPDATLTAEQMAEDSSYGSHGITQSLTKAAAVTTYTLSVYASKTSTTWIKLQAASSLGGSVFIGYDPTLGVVRFVHQTGGAFVYISSSAVTDALATGLGADGNGWLRYILTFTSDADIALNISLQNGTAAGDLYVGVPGEGAVIWGAQINVGSSVLPYLLTLTSNPNECTRYVKYNIAEGLWDSGVWPAANARTSWLDDNIFGSPLGADNNFLIQQHEMGFDDDGQPMRGVRALTGYADLGDGDDMMSITQCIPDFKWFGVNGGINLTLQSQNYSEGKTFIFGPFPITSATQWFNPRVRARQIACQFDWREELGFSARLGAMRFRVKPTGKHP